jgi:hypothetical protein
MSITTQYQDAGTATLDATTAYDAVVGLDNATLDAELAAFYQSVYPNLLRSQVDVGADGIASLGFDVQAAPTANLTPSSAARAHVEQLLAAPTTELAAVGGLPHDARAALVDAAVGATFDLTAAQVQLTINYSSGAQPTVIDAGVSVSVSVQTGTDASGQNYLTLQAVTGSVSIPSDPALEAILNNAAMPALLAYLDANLLTPFQVPALQYQSLTLSMPVPAVQNGYLLAFSALGATQPDVPDPGAWPTGTVFIGTDAAVLVAAANTVLPIGPSSGFSWEIISGTASATVGPVGEGGVTVNGDGSISVQVPCNAEAQLTVHTPWPFPNFSFGPSATVVLAATATPAVVGGELQITLNSIDSPSFDFSWGDIPGWVAFILDPLLDGLGDALGAILAPLVTQAVSGLTFSVVTVPSFNVSLGGSSYTLALAQATTAGGQGPQGALLLVEGQPSFTPASS